MVRSDVAYCTTHYSLLTTHYSLLTTHYSLLTTHYSLLTIHYSLLTTHYSLLTTHYSLLTTHYSLLTPSLLTPADCSPGSSRRALSACRTDPGHPVGFPGLEPPAGNRCLWRRDRPAPPPVRGWPGGR